MFKLAKIPTLTYKTGNITILVSKDRATIKNSYMSVSFALGTKMYFVYSEMVKKVLTGGDEEEKEEMKASLSLLTNVLVSCMVSHGEVDFIRSIQAHFESIMNKNPETQANQSGNEGSESTSI